MVVNCFSHRQISSYDFAIKNKIKQFTWYYHSDIIDKNILTIVQLLFGVMRGVDAMYVSFIRVNFNCEFSIALLHDV